jgi:hypothetical protein
MELLGKVDHGVIVPQGDVRLPEGAIVRVEYDAPEPSGLVVEYDERGFVKFPLIRSKQPGSVTLTNEKIQEMLDEEEFSP